EIEQLALVARLAHERHVHPRIGELIAECEADSTLVSDPVEAANLREMRRDYERATKLPASLVAEMSETSSRALEAWKEAREKSEFELFRPWLQKQLELNRRKAECYGAPENGELYDALLEDYEPGMTAAELEKIFKPLREDLSPLIAELASAPDQPDDGPQRARIPIDAQKDFNLWVSGRVGYDLEAGRLDVSTHPFTEGLAPGDTRITTRFTEDGFTEALSSTLHEVGHALYEQGLPKKERQGEPLAQSTGLGTHESQSRMWENQVGRSRAFWIWALPEAQRRFGSGLDAFTPDDLYRSVNVVRPGFIRVEADETTYNLHIMLRFDLERALLRGDLDVAGLPAAWNERIQQDLGLDVPDDRRGCLQDIHWSMGAIGYFPTYTLGNLYAAQYWEAIVKAIPDLEKQIERGEFSALLGWLREKIHGEGRRYRASELCEKLSGRSLDHRPLIDYLKRKLEGVYPTRRV
ncbi:MAG: carboxypeptidase M32, partial [Acidobacteriota bacterium]|nr:carboxypeptidase M32 [Acidobacteriota bacterium]